MHVYRIKLTFWDISVPVLRITTYREYYVEAPSLDAAIATAKAIPQPEGFGKCMATEGQVIDIIRAEG